VRRRRYIPQLVFINETCHSDSKDDNPRFGTSQRLRVDQVAVDIREPVGNDNCYVRNIWPCAVDRAKELDPHHVEPGVGVRLPLPGQDALNGVRDLVGGEVVREVEAFYGDVAEG